MGCNPNTQQFKILGIPSTRFSWELDWEPNTPKMLTSRGVTGWHKSPLQFPASEKLVQDYFIRVRPWFIVFCCEFAVPSYRSTAPALPAWSFLPRFLPFLFPPQRRTLAMALMANKKKASAQGKKSSGCHLLFSSTLDEALSSSDCHVTSRAVMMWLTRCPWINVFLFFP